MKTVIFIGGFFHLAFFIFHLYFWKLFKWKKDLQSLSQINRAVMQILNLRLTWLFLVFAYISFFYADELLTSGLGKTLLIGIGLSWLMRAIEQVIFFGLRTKASVGFFIVFLIGAGIYFYPLVS